METSLCIANERICAVTGTAAARRVRIRDYASVTLPEGAFLNGVITDERLLALAFDELKEKLPKRALSHVRVALRSSQILLKRVNVPAMPKKKLLAWAADEFSESAATGGELLYDYALLGRDAETGGQIALVCAAQKSLIEGISTFLTTRGTGILSIDTTVSAQIKLAELLKETRGGTFILLALDGSSLDTLLFAGGMFYMAGSVRLLAERDTAESAAEISRQVSSLQQFHTAQRSGTRLTNVFITGLRVGEERLINTLKGAYDMEIGPLGDEAGAVVTADGTKLPLSDYAAAVGNLLNW